MPILEVGKWKTIVLNYQFQIHDKRKLVCKAYENIKIQIVIHVSLVKSQI